MPSPTEPIQKFIDAFGELGAAWGLPVNACRLHAFLYLNPAGVDRAAMFKALSISEQELSTALLFLRDYKLAWTKDGDIYQAHDDPWEALLTGLAERRARDLPAMQALFVKCRHDAARAGGPAAAAQMSKMVDLIGDLSAIHAQAFRLPPRLLRGVVNLSGRAARLFGGRNE